MKLRTVLSKINSLRRYPQRRRKAKLYRQWVKMADLAPEAIPDEEIAGDIILKTDKKPLRLPWLHIRLVLVGFSLGALCMVIIVLVMQSC